MYFIVDGILDLMKTLIMLLFPMPNVQFLNSIEFFCDLTRKFATVCNVISMR